MKRTNDIMNSILDGGDERMEIITTYMKRGHTQKCILDFSTMRIQPDEHGHPEHNIVINGIAVDVRWGEGDMNWHNRKEAITIITPLKTFTKMCKLKKFDPRDIHGDYVFNFKVHTQKKYELVVVTEFAKVKVADNANGDVIA